jgi:hypothetical protein
MHIGNFNNFHSSPNFIWVIKSRAVRWGRHVIHAGEEGRVHMLLAGESERKNVLERFDVEGRIMLTR